VERSLEGLREIPVDRSVQRGVLARMRATSPRRIPTAPIASPHGPHRDRRRPSRRRRHPPLRPAPRATRRAHRHRFALDLGPAGLRPRPAGDSRCPRILALDEDSNLSRLLGDLEEAERRWRMVLPAIEEWGVLGRDRWAAARNVLHRARLATNTQQSDCSGSPSSAAASATPVGPVALRPPEPQVDRQLAYRPARTFRPSTDGANKYSPPIVKTQRFTAR
jgi:hypothetical protein